MARQAGRVMRAAAALATLACVAGAVPNPARQLAGRYDAEFPDALVGGEHYTGRNVVEVVPVAPHAAYVRFHLDFYNGHICSLSGVARAEHDMLVYREPPRITQQACTLRIEHRGDKLAWSDAADSCRSSCGMRGSFVKGAVAWSSKRPITYMARLKASRQFQVAVSEWKR